MKKLLVFGILSASIGIFYSACSKKDSNNDIARNKCQMVTITDTYDGNASAFNVSYNNDEQISTVQRIGSNGYTRTFSYFGSMILVNTSSGGTVTQIDSIQVNSSGMMVFFQSRFLPSNDKNIYTYSYKGNNELLKSTFQSNGGPISTSTYTYSNGDLVSASDGNSTTNLAYYVDKPSTDGDYLQVVQLINYGALYIKSAHLVKTAVSGDFIQNFNYDFDSEGKIIRLTASSGESIETLSYQFDCE